MVKTQEELAEKLNVTSQAVSQWENEKSLPDITLIPRISMVLDLSCDTLLMGKEERTVNYEYAGIAVDTADIMPQKEIDALFKFQKMDLKTGTRVVLHADNSDYLRSMVTNILFTRGYNVLEEKDGVECMDILLKERPDILLLDINMPGYNGIEVLEQMKKDYPNIPILMLSAIADSKTVQETLRLGAKGFLAKPFGAEDLLEHLNSI